MLYLLHVRLGWKGNKKRTTNIGLAGDCYSFVNKFQCTPSHDANG